jgi:hypothetical protein
MGQNHKSCRVVSSTAYGKEHSFWSSHTAEQFWTTKKMTHCVNGSLTLILLTWTIWRAPTNVSKWRMGFNSAFKGLMCRAAFPYSNALRIWTNSQAADAPIKLTQTPLLPYTIYNNRYVDWKGHRPHKALPSHVLLQFPDSFWLSVIHLCKKMPRSERLALQNTALFLQSQHVNYSNASRIYNRV